MMATYFHGGTEIQAAAAAAAAAGGGGGGENLQTLYLMNPSYMSAAAAAAAYSESHHNHQQQQQQQASPNNMAFLNQGGISPHQQQQHQLIGIPLSGPHHSNDHGRGSDHNQHQIPSGAMHHGLPPVSSRVQYNLWSPTNEGSPTQPGPIHDLAGQMGFRRAGSAAQGLSLSLSAGQQHHQHQGSVGGGEDMRMSVTVAGGPGMSNNNGVIVGSKYLRAAQELLEEVVNVGGCGGGGGDNGDSGGSHKHKAKAAVKDDNDDDNDVAAFGGGQGGGGGGESSSGGKKVAAELSTAQRQELQMKKAKLLNMLDEVEQRYKQYNTQIQVVVSSFEQAAGIGSAKSYTSLALKTISKQFRCLKDAITSQIKATSKSLGEDDNGGVKLEGGAGSRLRFVDHQLRQQRALQQLGMMQHNAWRPQRGLPERAVSVLRAWLFEHFLHPYPKDSDKHMLAKQTGLTRSQVSNWFINARVRLWKPMVEEMYVEEMKSQEQNGGTSEDNTNTNTNTTATTNNGGAIGTSSSKHELNHDNSPTNRTSTITQQQQQQHDDIGLDQNLIQTHQNDHNHQTTNDMISSLSAMSATSSQGFTLIGSTSDMESLMARSPKKQRSNSDMNSPSSILSMDMEMKPIDLQHQKSYGHPDQRQHHSLLSNSGGDSGSGFNPYIVNDIGRFNPDQQLTPSYHGNAVSLTLGLPHGENNNLGSLSENHQQNFFPTQGMQLGRRLDIGPGEADFCGISMGQPSHPSNGYESIDIQNRKRFAAQILHDFVA